MGLGDLVAAPFRAVGGVAKGALKLGAGVLKVGGDLVGGAVTKGVGLFSPGAQKWLEQQGQNIKDGIGNWFDKKKNEPELGKIGNLKNKLINMIVKFAVSLKNSMVKTANKTGEKIAADQAKEAKVGFGKDSVLTGDVNLKTVPKDVASKTQSKGQSLDNLMSNAKSRMNATEKANKTFGMGLGASHEQSVKR